MLHVAFLLLLLCQWIKRREREGYQEWKCGGGNSWNPERCVHVQLVQYAEISLLFPYILMYEALRGSSSKLLLFNKKMLFFHLCRRHCFSRLEALVLLLFLLLHHFFLISSFFPLVIFPACIILCKIMPLCVCVPVSFSLFWSYCVVVSFCQLNRKRSERGRKYSESNFISSCTYTHWYELTFHTHKKLLVHSFLTHFVFFFCSLRLFFLWPFYSQGFILLYHYYYHHYQHHQKELPRPKKYFIRDDPLVCKIMPLSLLMLFPCRQALP